MPSLRLFRNETQSRNPPPTVPGALQATVGPNGSGRIRMDARHRPEPVGRPDLQRAGRAQCRGVDLVTPNADVATGRLLVPQRGNAGTIPMGTGLT